MLKELSDACKEYGLKFGVYISPWDRNHPLYGTEKYNDVFVGMMEELFTRYGPIWELWWDGANGEGPNGKRQVYDWHRYEDFVRKIAPQTLIFSDIGPDCRWVGNEKGLASETNWNYLDTAGFKRGLGAPPTDTLAMGNVYGKNWIPAECDVSIRPGWFYRPSEDSLVKTPEQLFDLYLKSVGRGANLLLNVPVNDKGLISEVDSAAVMGFQRLRREAFEKPIATKTFSVAQWRYTMTFGKGEKISRIRLQEKIEAGQFISHFYVHLMKDGRLVTQLTGTTIGAQRILSFDPMMADSVEVSVESIRGEGVLKQLDVY